MSKNVLLLGRDGIVVENVLKHLEVKDVALFGGTNVDDVRSVLNK